MALVMCPAAYHRLAERGFLTRSFAAVTSRCIALAMLALACSLSLDVFVVGHLTGGSRPAARCRCCCCSSACGSPGHSSRGASGGVDPAARLAPRIRRDHTV